ncbi:MAG: hypothetical protein WCJ37_09665 [Syntrophus sp. (in: bacteria)]
MLKFFGDDNINLQEIGAYRKPCDSLKTMLMKADGMGNPVAAYCFL